MASLPPELSALVTAETSPGDRRHIIAAFKSQRLKYLVNVGVLTTGFDAPHVDVIAILRKTESIGLFQQIIGRGMRLSPGKADFLVLDYTSNMMDHCPDGDIFAPVIRVSKGEDGGDGVDAVCPDCGYENAFSMNLDNAGFKLDAAGYCLDLDGHQVMTEHGPMPGHYGRRCANYLPTGLKREMERCGYRWTSKPCPECEAPNDIAARYCCDCKAEMVNPNEKLSRDFAAFKKNPHNRQTDEVVDVQFRNGVSQKGAKTVRADWRTPYRQFSTWHLPEASHTKGLRDWAQFSSATNGAKDQPRTITYQKEDSGFYRVIGYNMEPDNAPA